MAAPISNATRGSVRLAERACAALGWLKPTINTLLLIEKGLVMGEMKRGQSPALLMLIASTSTLAFASKMAWRKLAVTLSLMLMTVRLAALADSHVTPIPEGSRRKAGRSCFPADARGASG